VRHQRQVVVKGNRGDLEIVGSDHLSIPFERASDLGTLPCAGIVEREGRKRRKKDVELSVLARRIGTRFGAMAQFIDHNRTERDVGDFRRSPAGDQLGVFLPEQRMQALVSGR
jgi:hypothetical protein